MSTPSNDRESGQARKQPDDPLAAAQRYPRPNAGRSGTPENMPRRGVAWAGARVPTQAREPVVESNLPRVLGVIGIICAVVLMPLGLMLGLTGHYLARRYGQPVGLPRFAWIMSIVTTMLGLMINLAAHSAFRLP